MESGGCSRVCVTVLMMVALSSSPLSLSSSSSLMVKAENSPCDGSGCCRESNFAAGPLNLSTPTDGFDARLEYEKSFIYHCVRYFTHFRWYRLIQDKEGQIRREPFPWGQGERVMYPPDRGDNQTVVIPWVRKEDDRVYVFVASNGTHSISGKFRLQVDCRDTGPSFATSEQPVQTVALGSPKTLHCAVNRADCAGKFYQSNVFWLWHNFTSGGLRMLKNSTMESVSVVCDRGAYFGGNCSVLIRHVEKEVYNGEFVCKLADRNDLNRTVRLVPIRTDVKTWLPYVLGIAGGAVVLMVLVGVIWWRYGHRIEFMCRTQPSIGEFEAHTAILNGEDHEELVQERLLPGVRALGYHVLEEVARYGRPELPENLRAVENSHSVLLTFSAREIAEDGQIDFLTRYVFNRKSHSTVLLIRCPDDEDVPERNPWKNRVLQSFKIIDLPRSLFQAGTSQERCLREARDEEKFWYSVQKHLPKPPAASGRSSQPGRTPDLPDKGKAGRNTSSTESHRPLMGSESAERNSSEVDDFGTGPSKRRTPDLETSVAIEEEESVLSHHPSQPQTARIWASDHQPSTGSRHSSHDDEVFMTTSAETPPSTTTPIPAYSSSAPSSVQGFLPQPGPQKVQKGGEGRLVPARSGEGKRPSGESSVLLESQESGYHSPGSPPEVVPFAQ